MSARHFEGGTKKEIHLREVTTSVYRKKFRGKLYCPMNDCEARISFSGGKYPHFRTWRFEEHAVDCLFYFDRIPMNLGRKTTEKISVEISPERRSNALDDAYIQMNLTKQEKEAQRKNRNHTRAKSRKITKAKSNTISVQQVLFGADFFKEDIIYRRRNISKKLVGSIVETDIGKVLLVIGKVKESKEIEDVAEIVVEENNQVITVIFEEAFTAEPLNKSYLNKFWAIEHLLSQPKDVQFSAIGEIRKNRRTSRLELVIYSGADIRINNRDISSLAVQYTLERHGLW